MGFSLGPHPARPLRRGHRPVADRLAAALARRAILVVNEQDPRDRRLLTEHTRRVSKALRILKEEGVAKAARRARKREVGKG